MFRLFEKYTPFQYLCKYYSKSFHSLDIAMYLLCNRKFCFPDVFATITIIVYSLAEPDICKTYAHAIDLLC